ncbi:MAG TPA: PQQ-binding-like beta-propeller repeat protein [Polyangiales bacterium]|nr:PQQ-binding-like beta-propeller repeat protein [Polyangiales bacterium]
MVRCARLLFLTIGCVCVIGCSDDEPGDMNGAAGKPSTPMSGDARWTMMGYDATNTYHQVNEKQLTVDSVRGLKEQWRHKVDGFPAGSPVIVDGVVYITATGGTLAVDLATGRELWKQPVLAATASPAYADGALYVHAATGAKLYKVDAKTGSILWGPVATYPDNPASDGTSSPVVAGDKVMVGHSTFAEIATDARTTAFGGVEAFSTADGARLWSYRTTEGDENGAMVWSTVAVDLAAKVVYATTGNNYTVAGPNSDAIHAINLDTGARLWVAQVRQNDAWTIFSPNFADPLADTDFGANPILAESAGMPIVAAGDKGAAFWAVSRETGKVVWTRPELSATHTTTNGGVLNNGAYDGQYFYVVSNEPPSKAWLHVLDAKDGADVRPPLQFDTMTWAAPSLANGVLFVPIGSLLKVYNAKTGEELNSFDTGGTIAAGAAAIADGHVIVKSGLQYMFAMNTLDNDEFICYGLGEPPAPAPDAGTTTPDSPTFSTVYQKLIVTKGCAGAAVCHGSNVGGALELTDKASSYRALVNVKAMGTNSIPVGLNCSASGLTRVVPNKPDESLFLLKLLGTQPCGNIMPPGGKVGADDISLVRSWIELGAKDD